MNPKYVIFDITGGIGKHIAAAAVIENIKLAYPDSKLIVVAAWPRIFLNDPNIWRVYGNGELRYFYDTYINDGDFLFLKSEPYHHTDYIKKSRHVIDVWTEQAGVDFVITKPKLYLNTREIQFYNIKYSTDKPILVFQSNGGMNLPYPYSWTRDMPMEFASKILNILKEKYQIIHIRNQNQPQFEGVFSVTTDDVRELIGIVNLNARRLLIDSYAQHAAAALNKDAIVLWPVDNVDILGYSSNTNVVSKAVPRELQRPYAYIEDYRLEGPLHDYPFDTNDIFNPTEIAEMFL
jgi:hypothetical protein